MPTTLSRPDDLTGEMEANMRMHRQMLSTKDDVLSRYGGLQAPAPGPGSSVFGDLDPHPPSYGPGGDDPLEDLAIGWGAADEDLFGFLGCRCGIPSQNLPPAVHEGAHHRQDRTDK